MKRLIVLGSSGMLGSEIVRVAKSAGIEHLEVSRREGIAFDAEEENFNNLAQILKLGDRDLLVNCIGWIPQKASGDRPRDEALARALNIDLPGQISESSMERGFSWLQIGTDCVYSGRRGDYTEADNHDPTDLYGRTKSLGEKLSQNSVLVRCSIVGQDRRSAAGLYEWFKKAALTGSVNGYTNHLWNGVSTTAFARLTVGLFGLDSLAPINLHWVPADRISKFELLQNFAEFLGLDVELVPHQTRTPIDRTLGTRDYLTNTTMWNLATYDEVPSIRDLVREFIEIDEGLGF